MERDAQKRIVKYTEGEFDCVDTEEITYDSKTGWVSKIKHNGEGEDITTFTYDEKGYLIKKVCEGESWEMGAEEGEKFKDTTTYTYESFDEHGNWTARSAKVVMVEVGRKLVEFNITNKYLMVIYFCFLMMSFS